MQRPAAIRHTASTAHVSPQYANSLYSGSTLRCHLVLYSSSMWSACVRPVSAMTCSRLRNVASSRPRRSSPPREMASTCCAVCCSVLPRKGVRRPYLGPSARRYSRSSCVQSLTSASASACACASYSRPTHSAGSAQIMRHGPPSAPRISRNFFSRTSGKMVVRWLAQSDRVGYSPGSAGSLPAMKSRHDMPSALTYLPSLYTKYMGTSMA
mmetsp:Transcript_32390/g.82244  ORF Transcript_32390/g.82244 Transcript_32390/m.82244 type:complete len:211 (-) Transcript_32390:990-1622(-)